MLKWQVVDYWLSTEESQIRYCGYVPHPNVESGLHAPFIHLDQKIEINILWRASTCLELGHVL